jgi:membrane dipeptidase
MPERSSTRNASACTSIARISVTSRRNSRLPRFLLVFGATVLAAAGQQPRRITDAEVQNVLRSAILIDTHNDVTGRTITGFDIGKRARHGHTDLPRLREGGAGAVFFSAYVAADYVKSKRSAVRALEMIDTIRHDIVTRYPNDFALATRAEDIAAARRQGRIAALIGIEGGHAIEDNLRVLRAFHDLGVRYITLTHVNTNNWADSSQDAPRHNGLTAFGRQVVREMNRIGMMVDISHVSDKTFWDVLEVSRAPVMASHSSCRALVNIPRNMTDEMIAAMAKKGGVIHINYGCEFLSRKSADNSPWSNRRLADEIRRAAARRTKEPKARAALEKKLMEEAEKRIPRAALADVVAHIRHVVGIAGIDAVGIGSDFDGVTCTPEGMDDVSNYANLTRALLEAGFSAADIHKIYGGNTLRLMRAVEETARRR